MIRPIDTELDPKANQKIMKIISRKYKNFCCRRRWIYGPAGAPGSTNKVKNLHWGHWSSYPSPGIVFSYWLHQVVVEVLLFVVEVLNSSLVLHVPSPFAEIKGEKVSGSTKMFIRVAIKLCTMGFLRGTANKMRCRTEQVKNDRSTTSRWNRTVVFVWRWYRDGGSNPHYQFFLHQPDSRIWASINFHPLQSTNGPCKKYVTPKNRQKSPMSDVTIWQNCIKETRQTRGIRGIKTWLSFHKTTIATILPGIDPHKIMEFDNLISNT